MSYCFASVPHSSKSELYHFGIKGMKWGVRRYRNKDGSYTPAGKRRYAKKERVPSHDYLMNLRDADEIYKYRKYYTDQELQNRFKRLNTEANIYNQTKASKRNKMLKNGAKFAIKTAFAAGPATVAAYSIYKNRKTTPYYKVNGKVYKWTKPFVDKSYEAARTVVDRW